MTNQEIIEAIESMTLLQVKELVDEMTPENEEALVKKYIKTLHIKHECDVEDEKPIGEK